MRLLLDEHFPPLVAEALRERGYDVLATVQEAELRGLSDPGLFELAAGQDRVLVTNDVGDYTRIVHAWISAGRAHAGLVLTADRSSPRSRGASGELIRRLTELLGEHDSLRGEVRWP